MRIRSLALRLKLALVILSLVATASDAAELKVLVTNGMRAVLDRVGPQFERATQHKLALEYDAGLALQRRIESDETIDAAILPLDVEILINKGKLVPGTRTVMGRTGFGLGVRMGAPRPDIGSPDALKQTLLNAKSLSYAEEGVSGVYVLGLLSRLGIAGQMKARLMPVSGAGASGAVHAVAKGDAEIVINGVTAIRTVPAV